MAIKKDDNSPQGNAARESIAKQQREHRRRSRGNDTIAEWVSADPIKLHDAVVAITGSGCAVQFGYTKDGSAYVVRIVGDGEPFNEYVRPTEDVNLYLESLAVDYRK